MDNGQIKPPHYRRLAATGAEMFMHPCCICGKENAPFGFDVCIRKNEPGRWYCAEHKGQHDGTAVRDNAAATTGRASARIEDAGKGLSEVGSSGPPEKDRHGTQAELF